MEETLQEILNNKKYFSVCPNFAEKRKANKLTSMQREVLSNESFWDSEQNVVIRGATSSGKTLLAEIAALRQLTDKTCEENGVVFLVPLRALVSAQCQQFRKDFENVPSLEGQPMRIYESSADYQDHDEEILAGNYDIAVIVYEKFFSMMNNDSTMLDSCGLIVVDELQMFSSAERGPKMEFSIMRVLERQKCDRQQIRLMGLTTSESDVGKLCKWLNAKELGNDVRPVGLKQYFVSYRRNRQGRSQRKDIVGENGYPLLGESEADTLEENIEIQPQYFCGEEEEDKKRQVLLSILSKWMDIPAQSEEQAGARKNKKVLVFINSKGNGKAVAKLIASKFSGFRSPKPENAERRKELEKNFEQAIESFGDEEDVIELKKLVPQGIAFHNSGLPANVREAIEEDFRDSNGKIQLIICTETLMIGMNLPADVVILYDGTVFHGAKKAVPLSVQEYKNFIGRAGRLGFGEEGESYLLTEKITKDYPNYTTEAKTEIVSAFNINGAAKAADLTPYFLSWIGEETNAEERIQEGVKLSFCCYTYADDHEYLHQMTQEILQSLEKIRIYNSQKDAITLVHQNKNGWGLTHWGKALAPYALEMDTAEKLLSYQIQKQEELKQSCLQFEAESHHIDSKNNAPEVALPPVQLFELLNMICRCEEVEKNPALRGCNQDRNGDLRSWDEKVKKYLKKLYPQPVRETTVGQKNEEIQGEMASETVFRSKTPQEIAYSQIVAEPEDLRSLSRAAILSLWMAGYSMRAIRKMLQFNFSIATSDADRLAEVAAYLMEALGACEQFNSMITNADSNYMRSLSTSMKYGVPNSLVPLANTHTRHLTRSLLLRIRKEAESVHKKPLDYVKASTDPSYAALQKVLKRRERVENYQQQLDNKAFEIAIQYRECLEQLRKMDTLSRLEISECRRATQEFFDILEKAVPTNTGANPKLWHVKVSEDTEILNLTFIHDKDRCICVKLKFISPETDAEDRWVQEIYNFAASVAAETLPTTAITILYGPVPAGREKLPKDHLVISSEMFAVLLLAGVLEDTENPLRLLYALLSDLQGQFLHGVDCEFNTYGQLWPLVKAYAKPQIRIGETRPILYYYPGIMDYQGEVTDKPVPAFVEGCWGNETSIETKKSVVFYHPVMRASRSMQKILSQATLVVANTGDANDLPNTVTDLYRVKELSLGNLLKAVAAALPRKKEVYENDIGISFRASYMRQMQCLYEALRKLCPKKKILMMKTEDFDAEMSGYRLVNRLYEKFSGCRHIIVCDTYDYDTSLYTFVEGNVVRKKIRMARQERMPFPVYPVRFENVEPSQDLEALFYDGAYSTYRDGAAEQLAQELLSKMAKVEQSLLEADDKVE